MFDFTLGDFHKKTPMTKGEQDAGIGNAYVAVPPHERLVAIVDNVVSELPRLAPVEPGAEARQRQT